MRNQNLLKSQWPESELDAKWGALTGVFVPLMPHVSEADIPVVV
jgi:hypothetical protein